MKLQTSQFEYLMEEATETFGEAFTYRDPFGTTCTLEQIRFQLERAFALYTQQIIVNREILDQLVARNQHHQPRFISASATPGQSLSNQPVAGDATASGACRDTPDSLDDPHGLGRVIPPVRIDKDQGMVLLSAWLNQPHLKTDALATFDEFCQIELFGNEQLK